MPVSRLGLTLLGPLLFGALLCLVGCGNEKPSHGLKSREFESRPRGSATVPGFKIEHGETFTATVELAMRVRQETSGAGSSAPLDRQGRAVMEILWTRRQPSPDAPASSDVTLRYLEAEGTNAEAYRARAPMHGTLRHELDGRPIPRTLELRGGTTEEQLQAQDLLVGLLLAGYGGSYPWTPPRAVQLGEVWKLEEFIAPRGVDNARRFARETGLEGPEPTFEGTGVLHDRIEADGDSWYDIEIDGLIEIKGPIRKEGERGQIAMGDHTTGRASISATTGVPRTFEVKHARRTQATSSGSASDLSVVFTVRGSVVRTPPPK
ncbi:MAG: hypothetical protein O2894_05945 [Planctomycetota bacterium]|nr:hypothetical protein [Planctomycetota bacterium]